MKAGRPTDLTPETLAQIKVLVLDGKNMREIGEILDISYNTITKWSSENYASFADRMMEYRLERMFNKSLNNIEVLQDSEDERVNLQANSLVAETIGKKWFSKRNELTGAEGKELKISFDPVFKEK